ncbi:Beta-ketoacyl synthase protein [Necator americanus]|uniref:oleoyl-[acyl-carrier-protein] hydrolase n=1 Tax=Necator americanus TaxID=51031 RepID=W2T0Q7_NECAM|nr:Beta-ketoacyl synthase protein [Necator americanus]ETN74557.1 Beta-ketoacyl synthase protein [Necator americanus]
MFNEMDCQILRKHHVSKENLIPGAYQFYILLKWINSNSEQGTYFTLTNTSLSNPWKYEEGNEYELVQTDKNALHVIVNGETKCSSCASFNEHVVTPALDIISFRNECKTDCNMKQFYSKMAANGLAYDGQFQAIKSLKRNETRIFAVLDYKKPYAVWTLMDAALHAICLTVVDRRPDVYFLPIYVREIYLDHNLNPSPSQSIIALAEKVMENEKFIEADACIFVDDVLLFQCRKKLSLVLNSSQKTKHIVSEKSEGRRKVFPSIGSTFSSNHKMSPEEKSIYILGFNGKFCFSASDNKEFWQQLKIGIIGEESFTRECSPSSNYLMNMDITKWDPEFFGITPKEAPHVDVLQRLMMISVKNCLDNANLTKVPKNTGVFVGLSGSDFTNRVYSEIGEKASGYYSSGTNGSCVAGRIAHWLKLEGPVLVIDTACSSSFTALVNAADAIVNQKCDYAIVGGINLILHDTVTEVLKNAGMLSSKGVCQVFDANADGYIRSEVVGCILLSRYGTDARFKIARWAIGHNGEAASLQVPNGSSQERIMKQICEKEVSNVECHGTGTSLGDPIEIQAIARVHGHVTVSSVKSHVGHAEACLSNGTSYTEWTGLLRTLASEQQLPYKFVSYTELKDLNAELSYADIFECIFYNNSKRYVERLSAVKPKRIPSPTAGHLLITGGTGGVGRKIIELIKPNKATIVTRSSDSFGGENMSQTELLFLTSDLRSLELPRDEHYDVVVHCAGVVDNSLLANMNRLKFDNVCLPKSLGLSVLHEAMAPKKPAKLIIASSAACILGSVGQANYAFANGMMTSLAEQFDMSTQIIHWGPWKNVGLLHGSYAEKLSRQLKSRGWNSLEPADALDVLNTNAKNILVFDGDFKHISRTQNHLQKFLSKVVKPEETCSNSPKNRSNRQRNLRKNENDLQRIIKEVSGIADMAEKRFVPLMNLGVDSLMLEEIRKTINKELGYTITSREVYDNGTFDELSKILAQGEPKSHKAENAVSNADQRKENRTNTSTAENSLSQQKSPRKNETGLRRIIKEISGIADIEEKRFVPLMNLGVDSLMLEEIRKNISKELGYRITSREVYDNCTFDELSKIMARGELTSQQTQKAVNHANHREPDDQSADIAIIGCSGAFSGCESVEELWKNLLAGNECIQRTKSREDVFVDAAGIIPDIDKFDYKFWNMTEGDASALDPQIRVFLQTAYHALEKSGYIRKRNDLKIGVYAGAEPSEYGDPNSEAEGSLRRLFEMNMKDFVSTFTAHMLDLRGPAVGIYSACSTSLLAVTQACNSLRLSDVDIAIAGAVSLVLPNQTRYEFQEGLVLSKNGKCRPFDRGADGIVRGSAEDFMSIMYPSDAHNDQIMNPKYAQVALFIVCQAILAQLDKWGISSDLLLGHSVGEYSAAFYAGMMSESTCMNLLKQRGELVSTTNEARMLVIFGQELNLPDNVEVSAILSQNLSNDTSDFTVPFLVSRSICSATVAHRTRFIAISLTGEPVHWTVLGPIREYHLGRERKNVFVDNSEKIPIQHIIHSALHLREEVLFATKNSLLSMTYTETHFPDQKIRVGKTAAVIGGRGAIGSTYVDVLRKTTGVKNVVVLSRMPSRKVCIPGVSFYALDISDKNSVETTMSELYSRYGDLNTIVHSAGKTTSMSLKKSTSEMLSVLLPKIGGITNILEYLCRKNMNLENLLMTSSMSSFIALQGTEDYSAANLFMDALSLNGHPKVRRILSVQWPAWKNAGMAATIEQNDLNGILMRTSISPQIGKQIIKETLRKEGLIVHSLLPPLYIRELAEKAQLAEKAPNLPKAMSRNLSQRDKVAKIWSEVLGAEIYDDSDFFEHGGNSLSALRVIWRVNGLLNTNMTVDRLFEHTLFKDFVKALPCENVPSSAEVFDKTSPAELTHSQENMFLLQELERGAKRLKVNGEDDSVVVGCPVVGRNEKVKDLIGYFLNNAIVSASVRLEDKLEDVILLLKKMTPQLKRFENVPFHKLVAKLGSERQSESHPIFQIFFNYRQQLDFPSVDFSDAIVKINQHSTNTVFDLSVSFDDTPKGMRIMMEYNSFKYRTETVRMLMNALLGNLIPQNNFAPTKRQIRSDYPVCVLSTNNDFSQGSNCKRTRTLRRKNLLSLGHGKVHTKITKIAEWANDSWSKLNGCAIRSDDIFAVEMDSGRAVEVILAMRHIGAGYAPVDPTWPPLRKAHIMGNIPLTFAIKDAILPCFSKTDRMRRRMKFNRTASTDIAYVIHTSGSSGSPKGVAISQKNVSSFLHGATRQILMKPGHRVSHSVNIVFDVSVFNIFGSLVNKCELCIHSAIKNAAFELVEMDCNIAFLPSAIFNALPIQDIQRVSVLEKLVVGGETVNDGVLGNALQLGLDITQIYGPTECTVWSLTNRCKNLPNEGSLIGKTMANEICGIKASMYEGELIIRGSKIARGYIGDVSDNRRFSCQNTTSPSYLTGDMVRREKEGFIYRGRIDRQLKFLGHRVELEEIERAILCSSPEVSEMSALPLKSSIVAFIVSKHPIQRNTICARLHDILPPFMIPSRFVHISSIPLNSSGKIDKDSLTKEFNRIYNMHSEKPESKTRTSSIEDRLISIIRKLIDVADVTVDNSFFALGGHSLLLFDLKREISQEFAVNVDVHELFSDQTIAELAELISNKMRDGSSDIDTSIIIKLRETHRGKLNVYLIHAVGGSIFPYHTFLHVLPKQINIFAIEYKMDFEATSLKELAAFYAKAVAAHTRDVPSFLMGHSMGGTIAREMVEEMKMWRKEVSCL